jgi:hypothetical protein
MARRNYWVNGLSGTGKSAVHQELVSRGYNSIDADDVLGYYADPVTRVSIDVEEVTHWYWRDEEATRLLADRRSGHLFVCGGAMNEDDFEPWFTRSFTLVIDDVTLATRLRDRGLSEGEVARWLVWNAEQAAWAAQRRNLVLVDATKPLSSVVDQIVALAERSGL